jgi:hemoglobin-like flavoprotein
LGAEAQPSPKRTAADRSRKRVTARGLSPKEALSIPRASIVPLADTVASHFYDRLFELNPPVRALFKSDLAHQKRKLMQTLGIAVDGLRDPPRLIPVLEQLGVRHAGYMVRDHHYDLVGEALLWTLRKGLGPSFTPETEAAWKEVYGLVAGIMKKAASRIPLETTE